VDRAPGSYRTMEETGFDAIVETHHGEIYRYLRRLAGRRDQADDLSQETFLRAYRARRALGPEANVRAWLFTIATNVYRNHARAERRRFAAHASVRTARAEREGGGPEEEVMAGEVRLITEATIGRLPVKQQLAFIMRKMHDLDYETIGRSLECSPESARAHVFQALRKIRRSLDGRLPPAMEPTR
jgi:RNA polymerase sigma-70 factor (ECF subfamily)